MKLNLKPLAVAVALATPFSFTTPVVIAQGADQIEELVVVGSRREARSAADTIAPVDVISGSDFAAQATSDISDLLRIAVPSFNVNTQPISDAATIVRPANLRGLSPDNTLVLLNGKRRHRASVISFLGGGISDGAHGPDIGVFPSIGLKQVEVLRDGASSQYGSDAIAGVINFVLKDDREGGSIDIKWGSTYEGDGDNFRLAGNIGLPLGNDGFVNISAEFIEVDDTIRSVQRTDAAALIAAGNTAVSDISVNTITTEFAQIWGQPNVNDDYKIFVNSGYQINDNLEVYAFANYAERQVEGGFFFRNPTNRGGVFNGPLVRIDGTSIDGVSVDSFGGLFEPDVDDTDAVQASMNSLAALRAELDLADDAELTQALLAQNNIFDSVSVGDLAHTGNCPAGIPLTQAGGLIPDPAILASVETDDNCFSFVELFPGGFVPRFGGDTEDAAIVFGARGDLDVGDGLGYDISYSYGNNRTEFFINNTVNASLGQVQPLGVDGITSFNPGAYEQTDNNFNLDLNYSIPIISFASDLSIAGGFEYRSEEFTITEGDTASRARGILTLPTAMAVAEGLLPPDADTSTFTTGQGFASSSNGFGGFILPGTPGPQIDSASFEQTNIALYLDLEADVTDNLSMQLAGRYEDFNTFGSTFDWKVGALYKVSDNFRYRLTYSTGFHAPTTGQANVVNVSTVFVGGVLEDQGTIPLTSGAGQFVNQQRLSRGEAIFTLNPEESKSLTVGAAFEYSGWNFTVDVFSIQVEGRIATSPQIDFTDELNAFAAANGVTLANDLTTSRRLIILDGVTGTDSFGNPFIFNAADFAGSEDLTTFTVFTNNFDTTTQGLDLVANYPFSLAGGDSNIAIAVNYTNTTVTNRGIFEDLGDLRVRSLQENIPQWKGNVNLTNSNGDWRWLLRANFHGEYFEDHLGNNGFPVDLGGEITFDIEVGYEISEGFELIAGAANVTNNFPDELPADIAGVAGARFPSTAPFGFNGGQYYFQARYSF